MFLSHVSEICQRSGSYSDVLRLRRQLSTGLPGT